MNFNTGDSDKIICDALNSEMHKIHERRDMGGEGERGIQVNFLFSYQRDSVRQEVSEEYLDQSGVNGGD